MGTALLPSAPWQAAHTWVAILGTAGFSSAACAAKALARHADNMMKLRKLIPILFTALILIFVQPATLKSRSFYRKVVISW
jgi:hypothetical protein